MILQCSLDRRNDSRKLLLPDITLLQYYSAFTCFENDENADGGKKEDDMGACIEKFNKVRWAAQDPMYDTALLLFGQSADYRKLWLHLKPESCGNWVKSVGRGTQLQPPITKIKSPSHRSGGHRPHGAPMRPSHRSAGHRPHGGSMRPSHRPAGHRPHGPSMNPNGARKNKSFFIQAHSYETRPFSSAVKTQYRALWVPTANRNNPPVNRKFSTGRRNFPTVNRKFP
nr:L10-interacting MYB domain-containing protein-like [Tanacetum cinerariifolium]